MSVCKHRWTIIPQRVLRLAERARLPNPNWYAGAVAAPYCRDCGDEMTGGWAAWKEL